MLCPACNMMGLLAYCCVRPVDVAPRRLRAAKLRSSACACARVAVVSACVVRTSIYICNKYFSLGDCRVRYFSSFAAAASSVFEERRAPAAVGVSDTTARSKRRNNKRWWRNAVGAASRAGRNHGLLPQTYVYLAKKSKNIRGKVGTSENSRIGCERRELGVKDSSGVNWAACITVTRPCRRSMSWTGCAGDFCRCGAFEAA